MSNTTPIYATAVVLPHVPSHQHHTKPATTIGAQHENDNYHFSAATAPPYEPSAPPYNPSYVLGAPTDNTTTNYGHSNVVQPGVNYSGQQRGYYYTGGEQQQQHPSYPTHYYPVSQPPNQPVIVRGTEVQQQQPPPQRNTYHPNSQQQYPSIQHPHQPTPPVGHGGNMKSSSSNDCCNACEICGICCGIPTICCLLPCCCANWLGDGWDFDGFGDLGGGD